MNQESNPVDKLKVSRMIYPILIGLGAVAYMFYREFDPAAFDYLSFTFRAGMFLLVALLLMVIRDLGYIIRLRILTDNYFSWKKALRIVMLWEFTSAVTPSAIGGTSLAILYVNKEGLSLGRSSAVVMATSFLDELYFILMFPVLFLIVGGANLFNIDGALTDSGNLRFANEFFYFAVVGYSLKLLYTLVVAYGLFRNPRGLKWLLLMIFRIPFLRRWRHDVNDTGDDIIVSSGELRKKSFFFWLKAFGATFLSWTARYWVANALLVAFFVIQDHFLVFARQLVMWIMMLVSPTPGGSGFAEFVFTRYLGEVIPVSAETLGAVAVAMAFLWRLISYYPYLVIGAFMLPGWISRKFRRKSGKLVPRG